MKRLFLVLSLITAATAVAQTSSTSCGQSTNPVLNAATGQAGWTLFSGPGVSVPKPAVVSNVTPGWGTLKGARWVSVDSNGGNLPGSYTYEFTFCVCRFPAAAWTLSYFADNGAEVWMNGTQIPAAAIAGPQGFTGTPGGITTPSSFGLVPGTNTLKIVVNNIDSVTGLDALLRVEGAVSGPCPPPCSGQLQTATGQPGWTLFSSPGVTVPKPAVLSNVTPGWSTLPNSKWVSVDSNGGYLPGPYTYEFTFCVCQLPGAAWTLSYFADNGAQVWMNGTLISAAGIAGPKGFTGTPGGIVNSTLGLVSGTNTLKIVVNNIDSVTGLDAVLRVIGATSGPCCPNLNFSYQSRANSSVVNASLALTDNGPGNATNVKVTSISCTAGFVYSPRNGLLTIPFVVPGAANLAANATTGFNAFFTRPGASLNAPFSCTIAWTDGNGCTGNQVVNIP